MIRTAIIGVSGFGRIHYADLIREVEHGRMQAVCATVINQEQEPEKCAKLRSLGCELFLDYRAMLAKYRGTLDLCMIPTGIHMHAPMTIAALEAGANVFVEKPAAATVQDVRAMQAAADRAKKFVAVGYQTFYASETAAMKRAILEGHLGKLRMVKSRGLWGRGDSYYARNSWAGRLKTGEAWVLDSPINNAVAHQLNMICYLAGPDMGHSATLERIEAELYRANPIESADTACLRMMMADGVPLCFYVTHCPEVDLDPEIVVEGEKGRIHWTFGRYRIERADGSVAEGGEGVCDNHNQQREAIMARLRARIAGEPVAVCDLGIAGTQTLAVNGAHESSDVQVVPAGYTRRQQAKDSLRTVIVGIDAAIARAFDEGKLLSEVGVPWAKPGTPVKLAGYERFPVRKIRC